MYPREGHIQLGHHGHPSQQAGQIQTLEEIAVQGVEGSKEIDETTHSWLHPMEQNPLLGTASQVGVGSSL